MPPPDLPFRNVSWKVLTMCNYRCTYCLQPSFKDPYPQDIEGTVELVSTTLGEPYEIKVAGGELFTQPEKAIALTRAISRRGHWVSTCTNFSADLDHYYRFVEASEGRLYIMQVSLQLEYADPKAFLAKCKEMIAHLPAHSKLVVNNVVTKGMDSIIRLGEIQKMFQAEGITFYTDLLVDFHGTYLPYEHDEYLAIDKHLGVEERLFRSRGKKCRAGDSYFVLLPDLDAWTCWDSYLKNKKSLFLGNIRKGTFALPRKITICPFETCSCPTPLIKHDFKLVDRAERVPV
jgi:organic radical activating enzyme